jgi:hypothetical protein
MENTFIQGISQLLPCDEGYSAEATAWPTQNAHNNGDLQGEKVLGCKKKGVIIGQFLFRCVAGKLKRPLFLHILINLIDA